MAVERGSQRRRRRRGAAEAEAEAGEAGARKRRGTSKQTDRTDRQERHHRSSPSSVQRRRRRSARIDEAKQHQQHLDSQSGQTGRRVDELLFHSTLPLNRIDLYSLILLQYKRIRRASFARLHRTAPTAFAARKRKGTNNRSPRCLPANLRIYVTSHTYNNNFSTDRHIRRVGTDRSERACKRTTTSTPDGVLDTNTFEEASLTTLLLPHFWQS